jgi:cytochrome c biogenesis protein CcmG, thiol:disulfide interchange protein DsbE
MKKWLLILPLALFMGIAAIFAGQLIYKRVVSHPSALKNKPAPSVVFEGFEGGKPFSIADFKGEVVVLNLFASWCPPCREEHPQLVTLSKKSGFKLIGIDYKDNAENARKFLSQFGNPYALIGSDTKGRIALEWGVYGIPETFIINKQGIVAYKFIGPISVDTLNNKILPELQKVIDEK